MAITPYFSFTDPNLADSIDGWEDFLKDGKAYFKTADSAHREQKKAFTPEILYNIIAMAIEKFVMAALMRHGTLPYNHTMKDLVEAMDETFPGAMDELREPLLGMDQYQQICFLDTFTITAPHKTKIPGMLNTADQLHQLIIGT